jgi:N6-L-threonylcarbamoyladenine synthase
MKILAIETSCDDTCAAVMENDRVLSSVVSSQTDLHAKWGGVVPDIAKRAHSERIEPVIAEALKKGLLIKNIKSGSDEEKIQLIIEQGMKYIDVIAVTLGPGLAIALGIGVNKAKELALKYNKKLVAVNHIEGHILSNWVKNKSGLPERKIEFPALAMTVSGGHTKIIKMEGIGSYELIGETLDDAAGEALDKAAKMMGLGYPGGPIIERLAEKGDVNWMELPRPLSKQKNFDYSFSGLKTAFYYQLKEWPAEKISKNLTNLSASFQKAVFDSLLIKFRKAIIEFKPKTLLASGGVMANHSLRKELRKLAKEVDLPLFMPSKKELNTDNAMMIGVAGYYKALRGEFVEDIDCLDRDPRAVL